MLQEPQEIDINKADSDGTTELYRVLYRMPTIQKGTNERSTIKSEQSERLSMMAKQLIKDGADINLKTNIGDKVTPLYLASRMGYDELVQEMLNKNPNNADIDTENLFGFTPLYEATINNRTDIVRILIANKADMNKIYNESGLSCESFCGMITVLYLALSKGYMQIAKQLLEAGADPNKGQYHKEDSILSVNLTPLAEACDALGWYKDKDQIYDVVKLLLNNDKIEIDRISMNCIERDMPDLLNMVDNQQSNVVQSTGSIVYDLYSEYA